MGAEYGLIRPADRWNRGKTERPPPRPLLPEKL